MPEGLLDDIKAYLHITWSDAITDANLTGMIDRGMARLQKIAGATLDFVVEDSPRALLLDYCRYANSHALEVFEKNFNAELTSLYIESRVAEYEVAAL